MIDVPKLDAYHLYEREWDSYEQLKESFEWELPEEFNVAAYACDRWAETDPDRVALYIEEDPQGQGEYTFGEIQAAANQLANYLESEGVERGDRVGINVPQKPEAVIGHLAAWKLGAISLPLSTLFGPDALRYRLEDSAASACIVDSSTIDVFRSVRDGLDDLETVLTVGNVESGYRDDETDFWTAQKNRSENFETVTTSPDDDIAIFYTSGTTGAPKGVRHGHRVLLGELPLFVPWFMNLELTEDDVYWTPGAWTWMGGLFNVVLPAMFYGVPTVGWNERFDPESAFELIETYEITNCWIPPTALRMMMQEKGAAERYDVSSVRVLASGGESLGETIVDWVKEVFDGTAVHEGYGQTEANMTAAAAKRSTQFVKGRSASPRPDTMCESLTPIPPNPLLGPVKLAR